MISEASQPTCLKIDPPRFDLVIDNVREVLNEVDSHKAMVFDQNFWYWQYRDTPSGKSRVYGILVNGELKGYYHVPVYEGWVDGRNSLLAMVQEVAISPELRGQGMFRKLADFVTTDLLQSGVHAAYTFPNRKSIHTFLKYNGYTRIATLPAYVLPVDSAAIIRSKATLGGLETLIGRAADLCFRGVGVKSHPEAVITRNATISPEMMDVFSAYQTQHEVALARSPGYLTWRFEQRPGARHFYYSFRCRGNVQAAAIFKLDEMLGNHALLLMDYAFRRGEALALLQLIQHVKRNGAKDIGHPFSLIFTAGSSELVHLLKKVGFLPIPLKLNPRPLDLLVRNLAGTSEVIFDPANWHVTLADWDVM